MGTHGTLRLTAITALGPATWGTTYLVTTELLPPGRPLLAAAIRALPVGLLMVAATRTLPRGDWWWKAAVLGALNIGVFFALLFYAAYRLPGGVAATLGAVQPLVVAALAVPILGQRLRLRTVALGLAAVLGVSLLVLRAGAALDALGIAAGFAATAAMAFGVVLTKRWGRPASLTAFTGWNLSFGGLLVLPVALFVEGLPDTVSLTNVGGYAYLALVNTALAYALWLRGLERLPVTNVAFLALASPVVATVAGWLVLSQTLTPWQLLGLVLALGSLVAAQLPERPSLVPEGLTSVSNEVGDEAVERTHLGVVVLRDVHPGAILQRLDHTEKVHRVEVDLGT
jgi:probable blue pigment (indigoidine) exporter